MCVTPNSVHLSRHWNHGFISISFGKAKEARKTTRFFNVAERQFKAFKAIFFLQVHAQSKDDQGIKQ